MGGADVKKQLFGFWTNVAGGTMKANLSRSSPLQPYAKFVVYTVTHLECNIHDHYSVV